MSELWFRSDYQTSTAHFYGGKLRKNMEHYWKRAEDKSNNTAWNQMKVYKKAEENNRFFFFYIPNNLLNISTQEKEKKKRIIDGLTLSRAGGDKLV